MNCLDSIHSRKMSKPVYVCPLHKIPQYCKKRADFEGEFYRAILNSSMQTSQTIYKTVIHGCHCIGNYETFDKIVGKKDPDTTTMK